MGRREQILETAYDIVGRSGIEGLHARTIAQELGINHAAVHYYYRTRADLIWALVDYAFARFQADRNELTSRARTPHERLEAVLAQAREYARPESTFAKNWASFFVASIADETLRLRLVEHLRMWMEGLGKHLADSSDPSPLKQPEILAAALIGIVVIGQACGSEFPASKALDEIAERLVA